VGPQVGVVRSSDLNADSVVSITVTGQVDHLFFSVPGAEPDHPLKLWEALSPPHLGVPMLPAGGERIVGRVLDVRENLPNGVVRRTFWRLP